jgi:hypothetical protein
MIRWKNTRTVPVLSNTKTAAPQKKTMKIMEPDCVTPLTRAGRIIQGTCGCAVT